jgi:hypothetical protein
MIERIRKGPGELLPLPANNLLPLPANKTNAAGIPLRNRLGASIQCRRVCPASDARMLF